MKRTKQAQSASSNIGDLITPRAVFVTPCADKYMVVVTRGRRQVAASGIHRDDRNQITCVGGKHQTYTRVSSYGVAPEESFIHPTIRYLRLTSWRGGSGRLASLHTAALTYILRWIPK